MAYCASAWGARSTHKQEHKILSVAFELWECKVRVNLMEEGKDVAVGQVVPPGGHFALHLLRRVQSGIQAD